MRYDDVLIPASCPYLLRRTGIGAHTFISALPETFLKLNHVTDSIALLGSPLVGGYASVSLASVLASFLGRNYGFGGPWDRDRL